jgi:hypothetical protein
LDKFALKINIMYKYLFRFIVTTLTILTANLITNAISNYMVTYRYSTRPIAFTFIGMMIIVVVFYPLFIRLEDWISGISVRFVKSGRSLAGKYLGLSLTFAGGILILFYFYVRMWYHIDFIRVIFSGEAGRFL